MAFRRKKSKLMQSSAHAEYMSSPRWHAARAAAAALERRLATPELQCGGPYEWTMRLVGLSGPKVLYVYVYIYIIIYLFEYMSIYTYIFFLNKIYDKNISI